VGVIPTDEFYRLYTGSPNGEISPAQWLRIPESYLATATNGEVFYDQWGEFSRIRNKLLAFYPEDVRLKKIAARAARMAQAGQYNHPRCLRRQEPVAAALALAEFVDSAMSIIFLLNKKYMPFYKWAHRALSALPVLGAEAHALLAGLVRGAYFGAGDAAGSPGGEIIERVCRLVAERLRVEGLSDQRDDFMAAHAESITGRIRDDRIRNLPLMEG
jgi:hypothetical protein